MELLVISTRLQLPTSDRVREVVTVGSVVAAGQAFEARSFDGIVLDARASLDPLQEVQELGLAADVARLVILPQHAPRSAFLRTNRWGALAYMDHWLESDTSEEVGEYLFTHSPNAFTRRELRRLHEHQAQLVHSEKFAAVGILAAEIAHEINNPATFVITNLTVMIDYVTTIGKFHAELREAIDEHGRVDVSTLQELESVHEIRFLGEDLDALLERSLNGLNRIHQIVQDLRYFGSDRRRDSDWVDLDSLVHAALNLVGHEARFRAELKVDLPHLPTVRSDARRLGQVILNVLVNAVQSIEAGSPSENCVTVGAEVTHEAIVLSVSDTGSGITPDVLEHIFEPFFTTKPHGEGTGLGLAISRDIMRSMGGEIRAESRLGVGSRFDLTIPRVHDDD